MKKLVNSYCNYNRSYKYATVMNVIYVYEPISYFHKINITKSQLNSNLKKETYSFITEISNQNYFPNFTHDRNSFNYDL